MIWTLLRRIRAAATILFLPGDRMPVTRAELVEFRGEWAQWQATFTGILEQLNAWNARMAKREKRALERALANGEAVQDAPVGRPKLALYRRAGIGSQGELGLPDPTNGDDEP